MLNPPSTIFLHGHDLDGKWSCPENQSRGCIAFVSELGETLNRWRKRMQVCSQTRLGAYIRGVATGSHVFQPDDTRSRSTTSVKPGPDMWRSHVPFLETDGSPNPWMHNKLLSLSLSILVSSLHACIHPYIERKRKRKRKRKNLQIFIWNKKNDEKRTETKRNEKKKTRFFK